MRSSTFSNSRPKTRAPRSWWWPKVTAERRSRMRPTRCEMTDAARIMLKFGAGAWNQWRSEKPDISISLQGAKLDGMILTGINFSGVSLRGASLHATNLMNADLRRADLTDADLTEADLISANLEGAILRGATLREADLLGANLGGAQYSEEDLRGAVPVPGASG